MYIVLQGIGAYFFINLVYSGELTIIIIAPMVWGPVSDHVGRRPVSAACLLILALSCVGLARVPTSDYWLLMLLRCLQASGSASTIAIGIFFQSCIYLTPFLY